MLAERVAGRPLRARRAASRRSRTCRTGRTGRRASRRCTTCSATARRRSSTRSTATTGAHHRHRRQLQPVPLADRRTLCRGATSTATTSPRASAACTALSASVGLRDRLHAACRRISASPRSNEYGDYPRTWNLESAARAAARAAARPVGVRQLVPRQLPQPDDHDQPELGSLARRLHAVHVLQPADRRADSRCLREACGVQPADAQPRHVRSRPRAQLYESFNVEFTWRCPGGAPALRRRRRSSGSSTSPARRRTIPTTWRLAAPRTSRARFCDDLENDIPYRKGFKLAGSIPAVGHRPERRVPEQRRVPRARG